MGFVFCFKQKTAYEVRISDWSSDVCSSDLCAHRAKADRGGEIDPEVARRLAEAGFAVAARARLGDTEGAGDVGIAAAIDADEGGGDALRQKGEDEPRGGVGGRARLRSEEHTSELQSLMRISYAVFCLNKNTTHSHYT